MSSSHEQRSNTDLETGTSTPQEKSVPGQASGPPSGMPVFPEGGRNGWLAVLGCWCALFFTFGYVSTFGVYEAYYLQHQLRDKSPSDVAWIGSIQSFCQFSATILSGPITDRYGPQVVLYPFSILFITALMLTSICKQYYQFLLCQGILAGVSSGLIYAPAVAVVGHYFHRKRPIAMAIASTGSTAGGIIFPVMLTRLLYNSNTTFGWSQRALAFIALGLAVIACMTVKPGVQPRKGQWLIPQAFLNPAYGLQVVALFFVSWGMWTPYFYLATYGLKRGIMSPHIATYLIAYINAGSFVGRMLGGGLSQVFGQFNFMVFATYASGILVLCWLKISSSAGLIVLAVLYGGTSGAIIALMISTLGQVAAQPNQIGTYIGMASGIIGLAALTGTPINGALIQHYGGYSEAIIFSGVCILVGACFFLGARFSYAKGRVVV